MFTIHLIVLDPLKNGSSFVPAGSPKLNQVGDFQQPFLSALFAVLMSFCFVCTLSKHHKIPDLPVNAPFQMAGYTLQFSGSFKMFFFYPITFCQTCFLQQYERMHESLTLSRILKKRWRLIVAVQVLAGGQLNRARNPSGDWRVFVLKSLLKDCGCSKPNS